MTGWAQINGGRQISPDDKVALDVWYVRNMSASLDVKLLLWTVPMLIFGERVTKTVSFVLGRTCSWLMLF